MKSVFKICVLGILLLSAGFANAQAPKFGHIDLQALVQIMPERATAEKQFTAYQKELEDALGVMQKDFQTLYMDYAAKRDSLSETVRKMKEDDLNAKNERIQTYQQNAQQQLQTKQAELLKPVFDKADKAIKEVGAEKGLVYVFDMSSRVILYNSKESVDILPFVKTKLGIQ
ncbi:outer membrane protein H precursor [Aquipluma nitroreducens]|uniref:Outer membrane protein H n=1 Tax=Aquipluma nitroreducens TaxID=2010828 RepID=A0A5K7SEQ9_9BACT|nr:OmpH family outer membrane protein [Aquipluma nitroreducens]BBE19927.1 outer membrane protein H precursor [Aquipluma nitroreducens]